MRRVTVLLAALLVAISCADEGSRQGPAAEAGSESDAETSGASPIAEEPTAAPAIERLDLFAGGRAWFVTHVDGNPIFGGPTLAAADDSLDGADATISGCSVGSSYPATVAADHTLEVDEDRALEIYDCGESRIPAEVGRALGEAIFGSPAIERLDDHLLLRTPVAELTFHRHAEAADLHGEWTVTAVDGEVIVNDISLVFNQLIGDSTSGTADLRLCNQLSTTFRYDFFGVGGQIDGGHDSLCADSDALPSAEAGLITDTLANGAVLWPMNSREAQLFDGEHLLDLRRSLALGPIDPLEVFVLPENLPDGFRYSRVETPTSDSHPTFVGSLAATDGDETVRISIRWTARPGWDGVDEDRTEGGPATERGGRVVYIQVDGRGVRIPFTAGTNVWLTFDRPVAEVEDSLVDTFVGSLVEVDRDAWLELARELPG